MSNSSIWTIDGTLSGVTTPGQSEPVSNGNKGVIYIPFKSWILAIRWFNVMYATLIEGDGLISLLMARFH